MVFLKYPEAGRVKTRLAATLGAEAAVEIYGGLVARALGAAGRWAGAPGREVWIAFDPADRESDVRDWLARWLGGWAVPVVLRAQGEGDLGSRLAVLFDEGWRTGYQCVMAIGTDCPELTSDHLEAAAKALGPSELVLGPTPDGGYYLIGLTQPAPALFANIPWSSPRTLEATLAVAASAGMTVHLLPALADVDTESDWRSWIERSTPARGNETG